MPICPNRTDDAERPFRAIFEASPDCIKRVSAEGRLLEINPAGLAMLEAPDLNDVLGANLFEFIDPAYHRAFGRCLQAVFAGETARLEFEIVNFNGRRLFMDQSAAPLYASHDGGEVAEMVAVTRDVSTARRAEADLVHARLAQDIARSAAALAARLGQDINTPLDNIIGYGEILLESAQEEHRLREAEDLKRLLSSAAELRARLNHLLRTALAEVRQNAPPSNGGDLDELIEAAVCAVKPLIEANDNRVQIEIGPECSLLRTDETKLGQCLEALLASAAARTQNGLIRIKARQTEQGGCARLVLSVIDTGRDLDGEELATLYGAKDAKAENANANGASSAGFAAAIKLARFIGGEISATGAAGQGARVTLKLPPAKASVLLKDLPARIA